jgi:ribosomal-protein-alanine N-acetyltransferase
MTPHPMQQTDLVEVISIENAANQFPWSLKNFEDSLKANHHAIVFIDEDKTIQAYTVVQTVMDEIHLLNICVKPESQGKGLGRSALNYVINYAEKNSAAVILLEVRSSNQRAQQLYLQSGFNEMSVRTGYYPSQHGREDAVLMAMDLSMNSLFAES